MPEPKRIVTMKGNPLTLQGNAVKEGDTAPDCQVTAQDMSQVALSSYRGKVVIVSAVPSLDTPVCDLETRRFNNEAGKLGDAVAVLTVSMDLPFAQSRWCGLAGASHVVTLSDHRSAAFGLAYGVLIEELRLLARAVFVLDREGVVRYARIIDEITHEPDYEAVLAVVAELT